MEHVYFILRWSSVLINMYTVLWFGILFDIHSTVFPVSASIGLWYEHIIMYTLKYQVCRLCQPFWPCLHFLYRKPIFLECCLSRKMLDVVSLVDYTYLIEWCEPCFFEPSLYFCLQLLYSLVCFSILVSVVLVPVECTFIISVHSAGIVHNNTNFVSS